jgi:hypothetical protein
VLFSAGAGWLAIDQHEGPLTIDVALNQLDQLMQQEPIAKGSWNLAQVFTHCAQSVEYSMVGYPQHKSDLFKNTVGQTAFSLFLAKGKMTHPLDEAIPGAPLLAQDANTLLAYERFKKSLLDFKAYTGTLEPHFAYGPLSRAEYEAAHVMHFNNHLQEIILNKRTT